MPKSPNLQMGANARPVIAGLITRVARVERMTLLAVILAASR